MGASCSSETTQHNPSAVSWSEDEQAEKISKAIDRELKRQEKESVKQIKLLLLGAGESGKTTVLKQMKIIHLDGFSREETLYYKHQIFFNICEAMRQCLLAMVEWEINLEDEANEAFVFVFDQHWPGLIDDQPYPTYYLEALQRLWSDTGVQTALSRCNEAPIPENIFYFLPDLERLFQPDYRPTHQDILRARGKTTGITETAFISKERTYRLFDVGGQRSERKKWIHCFENVTAIVFLASLAGYDQCLIEDIDSNVMAEALMIFDAICNSKWFTETSLILFLNKTDLFKDKIWRSDIQRYFPEYKGDPREYQEAQDFFKKKFMSLNRVKGREIYVHYTCAIDTKALKVVMSAVTDIILSANLQDILM